MKELPDSALASARFVTLHSSPLPERHLSPLRRVVQVLAALFSDTAAKSSGKKGNTFNSVSRRFINDLNALMEDLNSTKVGDTAPGPDGAPRVPIYTCTGELDTLT